MSERKKDGVMAEHHTLELVKKVWASRIISGQQLKEAIRPDYLQMAKNEVVTSLVDFLIEKGYLQIKAEAYDYGVHIECKILVVHPDKTTFQEERMKE